MADPNPAPRVDEARLDNIARDGRPHVESGCPCGGRAIYDLAADLRDARSEVAALRASGRDAHGRAAGIAGGGCEHGRADLRASLLQRWRLRLLQRANLKWGGHYVTLHFDKTVRFGGKAVGGIRVCGSPELQKAIRVEIKRPRRSKPEVYVLVPTDKNGNAKQGGTGNAGTDAPPPIDEFADEPGSNG